MFSKFASQNINEKRRGQHISGTFNHPTHDSGIGSNVDSANNESSTHSFGDSRNFSAAPGGALIAPKPQISGYESEESRLGTFTDWPVEAIVKSRDCAHSGLIALGSSDRAKCVFCLGTMYNWDVNDDPVIEHFKHFKKCQFMKYLVDSALYTNLTFFQPPQRNANVLTVSYVSDNWQELDSVRLVLKLGYAPRQVAEAKVLFLKQQKIEVPKYFSKDLIDIVAQVEETELSQSQVTSQLGAFSLDKSSQATSVHQRPIPPRTQSVIPEARSDIPRSVTPRDHGLSDVTSIPPKADNDDSLLGGSSLSSENASIGEVHQPGTTQTLNEQQLSLHEQGGRLHVPLEQLEHHPMSDSMRAAIEENRRLRGQTKCHICGRDADTLFVPCRHLTTCENCSRNLTHCIKCNAEILGSIKIYF